MNTFPAKGISVIVCCHNSSGRLYKTLEALAQQQCNPQLLWEIIIVDNASTDQTSEIAQSLWKDFQSPSPMRVFQESQLGLGNARIKGAAESLYSYLLFCDDDNWLNPDYVQGIFDLLERDPLIAACGGMGIPVFETEEPFWFYAYAEAFALGSQEINSENGRILSLYGAGLGVQKQAWQQLFSSGFNHLLKDRSGKKLSSSGDTELTYSFVLMGYKLVCSDELKFFHYLPKERLTYHYLSQLFTAFGNDGPVRNLYYSFISNRFFHNYIKNWHFHLLLSLIRLVKYLIIPPKKYGRRIYFHWSLAYIKELLRLRKSYAGLKQDIRRIEDVKSHLILKDVSLKSNLPFETSMRF